jgi:hypothetical protein
VPNPSPETLRRQEGARLPILYSTYFHGDYPTRAFVGVPKLLFSARYEVMGIAIRSEK